jgi:EAL domain-containing protein (putative c-di-GMP-specific phosphodiesterase class I)
MQLEMDLQKAIENGELQLRYQPVQALGSGCIAGAEALVRWAHPQRGLLLPAEFMAVAEETGLTEAIGTWVRAEVCADLARWREMQLPLIQVSVNLAGAELDRPALAEEVKAQLALHRLPAECLAFELPEAAFLPLTPVREQTLGQLHNLGVSLSLDHFGAETASLRTLNNELISMLKLDAALTRGMEQRAAEQALVKAIIDMAHRLDIKVTASCIESAWQRSCLKEQRCDQIQGFLVGRPMPPAFLEEWMRARKDRVMAVPAGAAAISAFSAQRPE